MPPDVAPQPRYFDGDLIVLLYYDFTAILDLVVDVERYAIAIRETRLNFNSVTIVPADLHILEFYCAVGLNDGNLRAAGSEQERAGRDLHQSPRFRVKLDLHIHAGDEPQLRIGEIDLNLERAGFRIDGFACPRDLALEGLGRIIGREHLRRGSHRRVACSALRDVGKDADMIELSNAEQWRRIRCASRRDEIANVDATLGDDSVIRR